MSSVHSRHQRAVATRHTIDLTSPLYIPYPWKIARHRKGGRLKWDPAAVQLYLHKRQKSGSSIDGQTLRRRLARRPALNANVLDYLLEHQDLIPNEWFGQNVFFWGTIYRASGHLCVRFLCWVGYDWAWGSAPLDSQYSNDSPAAVLKPK